MWTEGSASGRSAGSPAPDSSPPWPDSAGALHQADGSGSGFPDAGALTPGHPRHFHQTAPQLPRQRILET